MKLRKSILPLFISIPLLSFVAIAQTPAPSPTSRPVTELKLTRIETIADALASKHYFYLKEEGFRIQMPGNFSSYVSSKPATTSMASSDGSVSWNAPEAEVAMMFGDMDAKALAKYSPEQKRQILAISLNSISAKEGATTIYERDLTVNGLAAREAKYKVGAKEYLARNLFLGSRLFVFVVDLHPIENSEAIVKQALDTFEGLKN